MGHYSALVLIVPPQRIVHDVVVKDDQFQQIFIRDRAGVIIQSVQHRFQVGQVVVMTVPSGVSSVKVVPVRLGQVLVEGEEAGF